MKMLPRTAMLPVINHSDHIQRRNAPLIIVLPCPILSIVPK
jgi:hypothetical protein